MLTDTRFYIGIGVGIALWAFVIPWVRGTMAARNGG